MSRKPRLIDMLPDKRKRRPFLTQDGTTIPRDGAMPASCRGEPMPIWGEPIAMDARPKPSPAAITFDGRVPAPEV